MAKRNIRSILAGVTGGLVFMVLFFITEAGLWVSLGAGLAGLVAGNLIFRPGKQRGPGELLADGVSKADYELAIREARAKHRILTNEAFKITNMQARKKVDQVADVIQRILDDLKTDPSDFRQARQFLDYYLDATVKIVQRYVELYGKGGNDPAIQESLRRVEDTLDTIRAAFEKQLALLLENDKLDLDTELTVLRRTIELEGLGQEPGKQ